MNRKVKSLMVLEGITGRYIAKKAHVTPTWVSLIINNRKKSDRIRAIIAAALKMRVEELWPPDNSIRGQAVNNKAA